MIWALIADALPIYPLYALLFADTGLSGAQISTLFAIWSLTSIVAEVPTGALADRFSRRGALVVAGVLQATGYALWISLPGYAAFAAGFVLWGVAGSLVSGAFEALLYDGLAASGDEEHYASVLGVVTAAELLGQLPAALAATALYWLGGYPAVAWASVAGCLTAAVLAGRLPEAPRAPAATDDDEPSLLATLRAGFAVVRACAAVRAAMLAVALLAGVDALEEYFGLLARDWGVPTALNPLATLAIPLAGAIGAALGGRASASRSPWRLAVLVGTGGVLLAVAGLLREPAGIALVALFYGAYRLALVVVQARLQERIEGPTRATVASVAALGTEVTVFGIYAAWTLGGIVLIAGLVILIAAVQPVLLRVRSPKAPNGADPT